jgi:ribosome biogenesis protein
MSESDSDESAPGAQVRISLKLAPSVHDRSLEVASEPIAVPADIGRKGLTAVLNHLLGRAVTSEERKDDGSDTEDDEDNEKPPPIPFEFIVSKNRLLRKGVEKEARQHGISMEEAIPIMYFPATTAPDVSDDQENTPDWISCLAFHPTALVSGCYDGTVHVYQQDGETLTKHHTIAAASGPIKALETYGSNDGTLYIASASMDQSLWIHHFSLDRGMESEYQCLQEDTSSAITSLDFNKSADKTLLASGDGDGGIRLWDMNKAVTVETKKKQKTATGSNGLGRQVKPLSTIESAHSQLISGVSWGNHSKSNTTNLITGSWDHSIKLWDMEKQDCLLTLNGSRVVSCLDTSYHTEGVVATGHPDCTIRLWDVRVQTTSQVISDTTFRPSHRAWVSSVKWNPLNAFELASTSYDGTVKLWDIRSSNPLHTTRAFPKEEKGLCIVWAPSTSKDGEIRKQHLFAGGSDCVIKHLKL